jgi:hypothetical protein
VADLTRGTGHDTRVADAGTGDGGNENFILFFADSDAQSSCIQTDAKHRPSRIFVSGCKSAVPTVGRLRESPGQDNLRQWLR